MKNIIRCLSLLAFLFLAQLAQAQQVDSDARVSLVIMLGADGTSGRYGMSANSDGFVGGAGIQLSRASSQIAIRGDVLLHSFPSCNNVVTPFPPANKTCAPNRPPNSFLSWSLELVARLREPDAHWSPYLLGGAAVYTIESPSDGPQPAGLGLQAGVGFEVRPRDRGAVFIEARYMNASPGGFSPIVLGFRY